MPAVQVGKDAGGSPTVLQQSCEWRPEVAFNGRDTGAEFGKYLMETVEDSNVESSGRYSSTPHKARLVSGTPSAFSSSLRLEGKGRV
jgi:hypothetical protein